MEQAVKISRTGFVSAGRRLARDIRGVAAIEMAFIFPVMVILYIGLVDVTNLLMVNRRVTLTTSTLADLVTQSDSTITMADIDGVFESARAIFEPMPVDGISLNLWAFRMEDGSPTLQWQYTNGIDCGSAPAGGDEMETLMEDGNDIVVGRVCYYHDAILGTLFSTQTFQLEDELMLRPRQSTTLDCSDCPAG
ncbi:MAG TPA: TadE/TadG family type IV pilus assembly protein [Burkholderiales bacterium]|nr:TadE/TadG family type IV pilus assembly protein [Burkholderiales bacterium]